MRDTLLSFLVFAYGASGIVTFLGFLPTMRDLRRGKPSANLSTYAVWTATTLCAELYGIFILENPVFIAVVGLQLAACIAILGLRLRLFARERR